jgi:AraC-like DNA-binding protein
MDYLHISSNVAKNGYIAVDCTNNRAKPVSLSSKLALFILCTAGEACFECNMEPMRIKAGQRLCLSQAITLVPRQVSDDFESIVVLASNSWLLECSMGIDVETIQRAVDKPVIDIGDAGLLQLLAYTMRSLVVLQEQPSTRPMSEVAGALMRNLIILLGQANQAVSQRVPYTMADTYFRNFMTLIFEHVTTEHEVAFYADKLNITPKYLNQIAKNKSGYKAKEIISSILVNRIKREIIITGKSMKEIAVMYNFATQSSLGKFFRKHTGSSPIAYREHGAIDDDVTSS